MNCICILIDNETTIKSKNVSNKNYSNNRNYTNCFVVTRLVFAKIGKFTFVCIDFTIEAVTDKFRVILWFNW